MSVILDSSGRAGRVLWRLPFTMVSSNAIILSSSPPRSIVALTMPSSSPLPSPNAIFKRKGTVRCLNSQQGSISLTSSRVFTTASALLNPAEVDVPARIRPSAAVAGNEEVSDIARCVPESVLIRRAVEEPELVLKVARKLKVAKEKVPRKTTRKIQDGKRAETATASKKVRKTPAQKNAKVADSHEEVSMARDSNSRSKMEEDHRAAEILVASSKVKMFRDNWIDVQEDEERPKSLQQDGQAEPKRSRAKKVSDTLPKAKPVRKSRAKKPIDLSQGLIPTGNITKPCATGGVLTYDHSIVGESEKHNDIGLVKAMRRRDAWTPPPPANNSIVVSSASPIVLESLPDASVSPMTENNSNSFKDLIGNFGFVPPVEVTANSKGVLEAGDKLTARKRKLIELVRTTSSEDIVSPTKKSSKKKAVTITGRATAPYVEHEEQVTPLLHYFSGPVAENGLKDNLKPLTKRRRRSPVKGTKQAPILLSPESAMKHVANQDFVFGTSSQLAREESPSLLRDLHEAIQASLDQPNPFDSSASLSASDTQGSKLWSAAARNDEGGLIECRSKNRIVAVPHLISDDADGFVDLDQLAPCGLPTSSGKGNKASQYEPKDIMPPPSAQSEENAVALMPVLVSKSPGRTTVTQSSLTKSTRIKVTKKTTTQPKSERAGGLKMPNFATYTIAHLAKEIAAYHFKPIKNRDAMITLLETCWKAKHQAALQAVDLDSKPISPSKTTKSSQLADQTPNKKPRGRPKKDSTAPTGPSPKDKQKSPLRVTKSPKKPTTPRKITKTKDSQEEIDDSDTQITPSPPRRKPTQSGKPPLPLDLSVDDAEEGNQLSSSQQQAELFTHITRAVKSAPRAINSKDPSWHEKILLYDPIILEDLAVWLNTGNLGRVGWDGEVAPTEVKKWCESKSICCLWKENLRGGNRSRY